METGYRRWRALRASIPIRTLLGFATAVVTGLPRRDRRAPVALVEGERMPEESHGIKPRNDPPPGGSLPLRGRRERRQSLLDRLFVHHLQEVVDAGKLLPVDEDGGGGLDPHALPFLDLGGELILRARVGKAPLDRGCVQAGLARQA